jgi:hypothetical protein
MAKCRRTSGGSTVRRFEEEIVRDDEDQALVWYEFLCGPVTPAQIGVIPAFLQDIVPFQNLSRSKPPICSTGSAENEPFAWMPPSSPATNCLGNFDAFRPFGLKPIELANLEGEKI